MKKVLTIAGSDSGGGAGIQADLKTITVLGGYGFSVLTALTAQNTVGVAAVHHLPPDFVAAQFDAVMSDIGADAAKTGMLATAEIIALVAAKVEEYGLDKLVVDPVMVAASGQALIDEGAREALKSRLLPLAYLLTPNLPEAEALIGGIIPDEEAMVQAAQTLGRMGPRHVLVKGGHLPGEPVDILFDGQKIHRFPGPRLQTANTHGSGCTLSAALATFLAQGEEPAAAVGRAKEFITQAIAAGLNLGAGHGPTNPAAGLIDRQARGEVLEALTRTVEWLEATRLARLIPEVGSQIAYALPYARTPAEVAGLKGRLVAYGPGVRAVGPPAFGATRHTAKVVLAAKRFDPAIRAAMPLAYSKKTLEACDQMGLKIGSFSRQEEPQEIKGKEGSSLEWGTTRAFEEHGVVDVVYDLGEKGKEPIIRLLGRDPEQLADRALAILGRMEED